MQSKRTITLVATIAALGLLVSLALPAPNVEFSESDVRGRYSFISFGESLEEPLVGSAVAVGYFEFDGQGLITFATQSANIAGEVFNEDQEATGSYSINPDGTGSMIIVPDATPRTPFSFDIVLNNRNEILGNGTTPGFIIRTVLTRQRN